jgi:arylsulfate sulfotransferase
MRHRLRHVIILWAALGIANVPLLATITIQSMTPSVASPQPVGTPVTWTVTATDSNPNFLTFQFNIAGGSQPYSLVRDFNIGKQSGGIWTAEPFTWTTISGEGSYTIQVVAKDFISGETATQNASFTLTSRVTDQKAVVNRVKNPMVALFSAPACASGSSMRVAFYTGTSPANYTNWVACNPHVSMNFYVAGMLPSTTYTMYSQTQTGSKIANGHYLDFETGALPTNLGSGVIPAFTVNTPAGSQSDTADSMLLWGFSGKVMPVATDLNGNIMWYYNSGSATLLTRLIPGANILTIQDGTSWNSSNTTLQLIREIDLAGDIVRETNTGVIAEQLVAMGATDAASCLGVPDPAPVGTACLNDFDHEVIHYSIGSNSYTALIARTEKVFPPGTQGSNPNGPPVDILADMVVVLNSQWQVVWYFDTLQQLDINRPAVLGEIAVEGEKCAPGDDCALTLLLAPSANDWTHANSIQYQASSGDLLVSIRNQDWLVDVNYGNGTGPGTVLWRMGNEGDFTILAPEYDTWPWFSHQHDAGYANNGAGPLTVFDNGNTRVSAPPLGLGQGDSRGMALTVDETKMQVTPVLTVSLGTYARVLGSAQLLSDGLYFFQPGSPDAIAIEILPTVGVLGGTQVLNLFSPNVSYRAWQMPNLYNPPSW